MQVLLVLACLGTSSSKSPSSKPHCPNNKASSTGSWFLYRASRVTGRGFSQCFKWLKIQGRLQNCRPAATKRFLPNVGWFAARMKKPRSRFVLHPFCAAAASRQEIQNNARNILYLASAGNKAGIVHPVFGIGLSNNSGHFRLHRKHRNACHSCAAGRVPIQHVTTTLS